MLFRSAAGTRLVRSFDTLAALGWARRPACSRTDSRKAVLVRDQTPACDQRRVRKGGDSLTLQGELGLQPRVVPSGRFMESLDLQSLDVFGNMNHWTAGAWKSHQGSLGATGITGWLRPASVRSEGVADF